MPVRPRPTNPPRPGAAARAARASDAAGAPKPRARRAADEDDRARALSRPSSWPRSPRA
jgi:hypothetical protein